MTITDVIFKPIGCDFIEVRKDIEFVFAAVILRIVTADIHIWWNYPFDV
jgi:hypothetical protein